MRRYFKGFLYLLAGALSLPDGTAQSGVIEIPGLEREGGHPVYPIHVGSSDEAVRALARRAFSVHGAYRLVPEGQAVYRIQVEREGNQRARFSVRGGDAARNVSGRVVEGVDWRDAVLRACDQAVERTSGLPGFFASRLAFVGERTGHKEIYVGDLFFQRYRAVTQDHSESVTPRWSPDGKRILYTGYFRSGFPEIYLLDLESNSRQVIARYRGTNQGGVFSPDGRQIAMVLSSPGNSELYLADSQGRGARRMTYNNSLEASPSFSPDGRRVVLTSDPMGLPQIYVMELNRPSRNHEGMRRIARNVSRNCSEPVWNPVYPNLIAFSLVQGPGFLVGLYDLDTDETRVLTTQADSIEPYWLRDGRHLVFTVRARGARQLHLLDTWTGRQSSLHSAQVGNVSQGAVVYPGRP